MWHPPDTRLFLSLWSEALAFLGMNTNRLDLLRQAEKKALKALDRVPDHVDVWYRYGLSLYAQGKYFEDVDYFLHAIEKLHSALSLDKKHVKSLHYIALSYFSLGLIMQDISHLKEAKKYFEQAKAIRPNDSGIWHDYGILLMKLGEVFDEKKYVQESVEYFEQALKLQENHSSPECLFHYACSLDFLGGFTGEVHIYEKAASIFHHVLKIEPGYYHVRYNLALVYAHLGELTSDIDFLYPSV